MNAAGRSGADRGDAQGGDVVQHLRHRYDELTKSQKRIAEAIVEDPEFVAFATVDKMAARLGISPSTVVRFTYRLGLTGYPDLQERVRELVRSQMRSGSVPGDADSIAAHLGNTAFSSSLDHDFQNLRQTVLGLDPAELDAAVDLLASANRIFVVADGTAYAVAAYLTIVLDRTRGGVDFVRADSDSIGHLIDTGPDDVVFAITFPPYASTVLRVVRWAKEKETKIVSILDSPIAPVGQLVDIGIRARVSGVGPHNTMVSAMAVVTALLNGLFVQSEEGALERYATISSLGDEWDLYVLKRSDEA